MVRVGFPGGPRQDWFDRSALDVSIYYETDGVIPHSTTLRASYTVPTGKKALVCNAQVTIIRTVAATTHGRAEGEAVWGAGEELDVIHQNNTVDYQEREVMTCSGYLMAGSGASIYTRDPSVGGTLGFRIYLTITEFNA